MLTPTILTMVHNNYAPDATVVSDLGRQYTASELRSRCDRLLDQLALLEISSVGLYASNGIDWLVTDLACQHAGLCILPIPTFFSAAQIKHALTSCQLDALLTDDPEVLTALREIRHETVSKVAGTDLHLVLLRENQTENVMPAATGKITFTSGSTGQPKGVCLSHLQLQMQAATLCSRVDLTAPRHLCLLPLSTLLENVAGLYAPLMARGEIIIPSQEALGFSGSVLQDQAKLLAVISATRPETLILVPQLLLLLVTAVQAGWQQPDSLKFIAVGGSKVSSKMLATARQLGLPAYEGYGLSECGSVVSLNTPAEDKSGSCGQALQHLQLSFDHGEVCVSGNAMLGYVNEPASWNQGLIRTGDLGHLDEAGFLHIDGRKKNLLISSFGRNISPEWVESELLANPALVEAVVVGDARPYCSALLTSRDPAMSESSLQPWIDQVNDKLPDYARIQRWRLLPGSLARQPGLLTENGRPRRAVINVVFAKEIEALYQSGETACLRIAS
jgi:long-chain acyl-CoA synthetase